MDISVAYVLSPPPDCDNTYILLAQIHHSPKYYVKVGLNDVQSVMNTLKGKPCSVSEAKTMLGVDIRDLVDKFPRSMSHLEEKKLPEEFQQLINNYVNVYDFGEHLLCCRFPWRSDPVAWYMISKPEPQRRSFLRLLGMQPPTPPSRFQDFKSSIESHELDLTEPRHKIDNLQHVSIFVPVPTASAKGVAYMPLRQKKKSYPCGDVYIFDPTYPIQQTPIYLYEQFLRRELYTVETSVFRGGRRLLKFHGGELMFMYEAGLKGLMISQIGTNVLIGTNMSDRMSLKLVDMSTLPLWLFTAGTDKFESVEIGYSPKFSDNHHPRMVYKINGGVANLYILHYSGSRQNKQISVDSYEFTGVESRTMFEDMLADGPCLVGDGFILFQKSNQIAVARLAEKPYAYTIGSFICFNGACNWNASRRHLIENMSDLYFLTEYYAVYDDQVTLIDADLSDRCAWFNFGELWINPATNKFLDDAGKQQPIRTKQRDGSSYDRCCITDRYAFLVRKSEQDVLEYAILSIYPDPTNWEFVRMWLDANVVTPNMRFVPMSDKLAHYMAPATPSAPEKEEPPITEKL